MREETPRPIMLSVEDGMFKGKEIVFCKDCKYWAEFTLIQPPKNYCGRLIQADYNNHNFGFEMDADDFCSRGDKK